jgi:hypothetical protein
VSHRLKVVFDNISHSSDWIYNKQTKVIHLVSCDPMYFYQETQRPVYHQQEVLLSVNYHYNNIVDLHLIDCNKHKGYSKCIHLHQMKLANMHISKLITMCFMIICWEYGQNLHVQVLYSNSYYKWEILVKSITIISFHLSILSFIKHRRVCYIFKQ